MRKQILLLIQVFPAIKHQRSPVALHIGSSLRSVASPFVFFFFFWRSSCWQSLSPEVCQQFELPWSPVRGDSTCLSLPHTDTSRGAPRMNRWEMQSTMSVLNQHSVGEEHLICIHRSYSSLQSDVFTRRRLMASCLNSTRVMFLHDGPRPSIATCAVSLISK